MLGHRHRFALGSLSIRACLALLCLGSAAARAEQFVLFDATFTFTKQDADNSKPSPSHFYVRDKLMNADRPKDWTNPIDYRNGTAHVRLEVLEKPVGGEATTWSVCYIPNKGRDKGYGCFNTPVYKEAGVYENDISMTKFWQNDSIVWEQGIKEMHLVIKDNSGGSGHAHKRQDHEKFFPTKVRMTVVQVSANAKYDASILASAPAAKVETQSAALPADNPFAVPSPLPFHAPAFDKAKTEYFMPTFTFGMKQQLAEMNAIASQTEAPTFQNTIEAMERSGAVLTRVDNVFSNLTSAEKTEPLQNIETELAPLRAAHSDNILLNRLLFQRVEKLWQTKASLGLTEEQGEVLKQRYESFVRAGAKLSDQEQARIRSLNEQLSKLETKFEENLLAIAKERAVVVDTAKELDGLPAAEIAAAAEAAKARGLDGKYLLQISNTTRVPVLTSLNNRALRQRVWEASAYRGLGRNGGIDNRGLVLEIAQLRAERAKVLGYESHAAYKLQNQMAKTPAAARKLLTDLVPGVVERVKQETKDLEAMIKESGESHELAPWDWEYYAEKVRKARYQVDEAAVRPYFELDSVLKNGVFFTMNKLYGISFKERKDLPVYHPDVRVFDVMDRDGSQIGLFYADYFKRDTKRGGAWMSSFVDQSKLLHDKPVIVNCLNIPRPAEGEPALISFDNVTTLFHEMGHALHGLFSDVTYPTVAGTATPRDFVEFPSTFEEDWAIQPEILANYALHYQTKAPIPKDLLDKTIKAKKFNKGFDTLEYLAAALLDLEWHSLAADQIPMDVEVFEAESLKKVGASNPAVPPRYRTAYFAHIWSGGYSSSYYAYLWSESLAADAFAHMMAHGGCTSENGNAFRKEILSRGSSRDPMASYKAFRGGEPTVDALLIRRGLK